MADYLLIDGDQAHFLASFGEATVLVQPGTLRASGPATLGGQRLCVLGDEASVSVGGCFYTTSKHSIPGVGALEIAALAADQRAQRPATGGARALLVGGRFTARFVVQSPAMQPPKGPGSPIPDATLHYAGEGFFITTNTKLRGA